ncbi:hypothetical protein [Nannocystis pusilla]|uniref:hypothetical protein n=1 Tax=Nannocystis pusilla TaxID=889268 RepID=UPI003B7B60C7
MVSLILLALGLVWTIVTLGANTGWVEVVLYLPAADLPRRSSAAASRSTRPR